MSLVFTTWAPQLGIFCALSGKSFSGLGISCEGTELCSATAQALKSLWRNLLEKVLQNIKLTTQQWTK